MYDETPAHYSEAALQTLSEEYPQKWIGEISGFNVHGLLLVGNVKRLGLCIKAQDFVDMMQLIRAADESINVQGVLETVNHFGYKNFGKRRITTHSYIMRPAKVNVINEVIRKYLRATWAGRHIAPLGSRAQEKAAVIERLMFCKPVSGRHGPLHYWNCCHESYYWVYRVQRSATRICYVKRRFMMRSTAAPTAALSL
ncbi:hypothetical protein J6590_033673 [Homalodisca vitripennis]|nr:hypothetical protein J6590_033673 [Homalodisca vitripennis]